MSNTRINSSLLAGIERRAIESICPRLPIWVTPDKLTAFGTFGAVLVFVGYAASNASVHWLWLSNLGLVIHWFGDSLDGNVARFRKIERPRYGYFLDQTVDVIGNFLICFGMGLSPYIDMRYALIAMSGYHMASIYVFVRAAIVHDFHVALLKFGPTEMRAMIILMNLTLIFFGVWSYSYSGFSIRWTDFALALWASAFIGNFIYQIARFAPVLREMDDKERTARSTEGHSE